MAAGWGAVPGVAAAAFYAGGVVAQKPLLSRASALHVTWLAATVGLVVCLPFAATLADEVGDADASSVAWMVYLGVFPTAIGFLTWAYALSRTTAGSRMGATTTSSRRSRSWSVGRCSASRRRRSRSWAARSALEAS